MNNLNLSPRTICVFRSVAGIQTICPLDNQRSYKEWEGCFSLINF